MIDRKPHLESALRWLRDPDTHPAPGEAALTYYILESLNEMYPERKDVDGNVIEPAGNPPSHAYLQRAARELALTCQSAFEYAVQSPIHEESETA